MWFTIVIAVLFLAFFSMLFKIMYSINKIAREPYYLGYTDTERKSAIRMKFKKAVYLLLTFLITVFFLYLMRFLIEGDGG